MAYTYSNTPVLSKVKIDNDYYYLKDKDVRSIIDGYNNSIVTGTIGTVDGSDGNAFVRASDIKSYVDQLVSVGLLVEVVSTLPEANASNMGKLFLIADSHTTGDVYDEYLVVRTGDSSAYSYSWEKIGNTDIDLSGYVSDVKFENNILKVQKGKGTYSNVHTFGSMADVNTASGKITTPDSASFNYTPTGSVAVTLEDSKTATSIKSTGSFTPSGSITGDVIKGGSIAVTLGDATTGTAASVTYESYTPEGTITAPTITVTPTTTSFNVINANGIVPSFTEGKFTTNTPTKIDTTKFNGGSMTSGAVTFPTLTGASVATKPTATFAKTGIVATVGTGDDAETLVISDAATASAMTDVTINGGSLTGGSYTAPVFTKASLADGFYTVGTSASKVADSFNAGSMPTLTSKTVMTGVSASATAPTFTGDAADIKVSGVTYKKQTIESATFTGSAATLAFAGTAGSVSVDGSYNKQVVSTATFIGTKATGTEVSLNKTEKSITVNPD